LWAVLHEPTDIAKLNGCEIEKVVLTKEGWDYSINVSYDYFLVTKNNEFGRK
jgi:hypothetical protein